MPGHFLVERRGANASFGARQARTRVPAPAFGCVSWDKSLNLSESGTLQVSVGNNGPIFVGFLRLTPLHTTQHSADFYSMIASSSLLSSQCVSLKGTILKFTASRLPKPGAAGSVPALAAYYILLLRTRPLSSPPGRRSSGVRDTVTVLLAPEPGGALKWCFIPSPQKQQRFFLFQEEKSPNRALPSSSTAAWPVSPSALGKWRVRR